MYGAAVLGDVQVRGMGPEDLEQVRAIYAEGVAGRNATFETEVPEASTLAARWLADQRWVAEGSGRPGQPDRLLGWAAVSPVSQRACYAGVGESTVYVTTSAHGAGVGRALLEHLVRAADTGGLWTLQATVFPENLASLRLHRAAGFREVGVRDRIARLDGRWRDTVLLERRRDEPVTSSTRSATVLPR